MRYDEWINREEGTVLEKIIVFSLMALVWFMFFVLPFVYFSIARHFGFI